MAAQSRWNPFHLAAQLRWNPIASRSGKTDTFVKLADGGGTAAIIKQHQSPLPVAPALKASVEPQKLRPEDEAADPAMAPESTFREAGITYVAAVVRDTTMPHAVLENERLLAMRAALSAVGLGAGKRLAHLKGFTSGLSLGADAFVDEIAGQLTDGAYDAVLWDGDDFAPDSFTRLLPLLRARLPALRMCAFLQHGERISRLGNASGFHGSWATKLGELTCILVDDAISVSGRYEYLGILALKASQSEIVFCVGGGQTLVLERELMGDSAVRYVLYDAVRTGADDVETHSDLLTHVELRDGATGSGRGGGAAALREADPRWNFERFRQWASVRAPDGAFALAFVQLGYLRHCHAHGIPIGRRQDLPASALHLGPPPAWLSVYHVVAPWLSADHADPEGSHNGSNPSFCSLLRAAARCGSLLLRLSESLPSSELSRTAEDRQLAAGRRWLLLTADS